MGAGADESGPHPATDRGAHPDPSGDRRAIAPPAPSVIRRLGRVPYPEALELQRALAAERAADRIPDTLLLLEHDPVLTLGRGTRRDSLPAHQAIPTVEIERGGDITWHGPGQLVGYWIRKLDGAERDLHRHLRLIEQALIDALATLGVEAFRRPGLTGVWVGSGKIASIGVAVRRWVTYHGFALNIAVDPAAWLAFRPCGLDATVMTDLSRERGAPANIETAIPAVALAFAGDAVS